MDSKDQTWDSSEIISILKQLMKSRSFKDQKEESFKNINESFSALILNPNLLLFVQDYQLKIKCVSWNSELLLRLYLRVSAKLVEGRTLNETNNALGDA